MYKRQVAAGELARVCRPGGRLGVASWRPEGTGGSLFRVMAPFQPPPPPGFASPFEWGREEEVERLLGQAFDLEFEELDSPLTGSSAEAVWKTFSTSFGPMKTLAESLAPERRDELRRSFVEWMEEYRLPAGGIHQPRPYLLALGTRR